MCEERVPISGGGAGIVRRAVMMRFGAEWIPLRSKERAPPSLGATPASPGCVLRFTSAQGVPDVAVKKRLFLGYNGDQPKPRACHFRRTPIPLSHVRCHPVTPRLPHSRQ